MLADLPAKQIGEKRPSGSGRRLDQVESYGRAGSVPTRSNTRFLTRKVLTLISRAWPCAGFTKSTVRRANWLPSNRFSFAPGLSTMSPSRRCDATNCESLIRTV